MTDPTHERLTVTQAANRLGLSTDAIRRRIKSGELNAQRDNKGQWWVQVTTDAGPVQPTTVQERLAPALAPPPPPDLSGVVAELRSQVEVLRERLAVADGVHAADKAAWAAERDRLLALVETVTTPRPGLLDRLLAALRRGE